MRLFCASRFPLASKWASLHAEEQWRQGDTEAAMQMPVSPMCQRIADEEQTKQSIAAVQVSNRHIQIGGIVFGCCVLVHFPALPSLILWPDACSCAE
eukprot:COSAG04_NODE_636_length_11710_cov_63.646973_10_plen_97_part_00